MFHFISFYPFEMKRNIPIENILQKTYYQLSKPAAYLGPDKLYRVLKSKGITHIGRHTVNKWLQNQDDYSLHKPVRQRLKKPES